MTLCVSVLFCDLRERVAKCFVAALQVHQPAPDPRAVYRRTSAPKLVEATGPSTLGSKGVTEHRATPSPASRSPSTQSPSPRPSRTSPALKVRQPERPPPSPRTQARPVVEVPLPTAKWEVLLDDGWVPFLPGARFKDDAGTKVSICHGQFWYTLTFDANGTTGKQANQRTGKVRQLRRVPEPGAPWRNFKNACFMYLSFFLSFFLSFSLSLSLSLCVSAAASLG